MNRAGRQSRPRFHAERKFPRKTVAFALALGSLVLQGGCSCGGGDSKSTPPLSACSTNACSSAGATQCSGTQIQTCMATSDSCLAWGAPAACSAGNTCVASTNTCGPAPKQIVFTGGTLADLKQIQPDLTFGELVIDGPLTHPIRDFVDLQHINTTRITATKLTITKNGGIKYEGNCSAFPCYNDPLAVVRPLWLEVSGDVVIDGTIDSSGANGGRTAVDPGGVSGACNCCGGVAGYVTIHGGTVKVTGSIMANGGHGNVSSVAGYTFGCDSGSAGSISLKAAGSMDLSGASIWNIRGNASPDAKQGFPASMDFTAASFKMWGGNVWTSEDLTFTANSTDIRGASIAYGRKLKESIGGASDTAAPTVSVLSPTAGATIDKTMDLRVQLTDAGPSMGVNTLRAKGPIGDITFTLGNCGPTSNCTWSPGDNILSATLPAVNPATPATLEVTAVDNKGNASSTVTVPGLNVPVTYEVEPNACFKRRPSPFNVQRFTLTGEVSQTDDAKCRSDKDYSSSLLIKWDSGTTDFCEDLVVIDDYWNLPEGTPVVATLAWDGAQDLDLYLVERVQTCSVRSCSQGWNILSGSPHPAGVNAEQVAAVVRGTTDPGTQIFARLLCVTWYDPNVVPGVTVPYTLNAEIGRMVTFNLTSPTVPGVWLEHVTGTSGTGLPFKYLVYTDNAHPNSVSAAFSTQPDTIQYHYMLHPPVDQSVSHVEVDASCNPVTRTLTLVGGRGTQTVNDTVIHWQGVAPCP